MATDFLGRTLNIGDDVIFLNYNGTSADLERGKITKLFPHTAEIGRKRRAEYKIVKILADVVPVVRCKDCANGIVSDDNKYIICCRLGVGMEFDDFCSHGERKETE